MSPGLSFKPASPCVAIFSHRTPRSALDRGMSHRHMPDLHVGRVRVLRVDGARSLGTCGHRLYVALLAARPRPLHLHVLGHIVLRAEHVRGLRDSERVRGEERRRGSDRKWNVTGPMRERTTGRMRRPWIMPKKQMPKNCRKKTWKIDHAVVAGAGGAHEGVGNVRRVVDGEADGEHEVDDGDGVDGDAPEPHEPDEVDEHERDVDHDDEAREHVREQEERHDRHGHQRQRDVQDRLAAHHRKLLRVQELVRVDDGLQDRVEVLHPIAHPLHDLDGGRGVALRALSRVLKAPHPASAPRSAPRAPTQTAIHTRRHFIAAVTRCICTSPEAAPPHTPRVSL
eukprot:888485-Rhodomonas_salina.4